MPSTAFAALCTFSAVTATAALVGCGYFATQTLKQATEVLAKKKAKSSSSQSSYNLSFCDRIRAFSPSDYLIHATMIGTVCYVLSSLLMTGLLVNTAGSVISEVASGSRRLNKRECSELPLALDGTWYLSIGLFTIAYACVYVAYFERLRTAFSTTALRLHDWEPKAFYSLWTLAIVFFSIAMLLDGVPQGVLSILVLLIIVVVFPSIMLSFLTKSKLIAKNVSDPEHRSALMNATLRLLITGTAAFASMGIFASSMLVNYFKGPTRCMSVYQNLALLAQSLDMTTNVFCLMCTFKAKEAAYMRVFGRVHRWALRCLGDTSETSETSETLSRPRLVATRTV
jgi:hypothetical protein